MSLSQRSAIRCPAVTINAACQCYGWPLARRVGSRRSSRCVPEGYSDTSVAVQDVQPTSAANEDILASCNTLLQQQLPADSSLQQLLEPLLPAAAATASDDGSSTGTASYFPSDDVATIAAPSTSLTVGVPSSDAFAAAALAAATVMPPPIDVEAREVPPTWRRPAPPTAQLAAPASGPNVQELPQAAGQQQQPQDVKQWARVVGVCGFAALLCYLDRTNISTAIVPMAEQFGWNKSFCSIIMSAFFAGYGATQVWGGQLSDRYGGGAVLAAGVVVWSLATALTPLAAAWGTWQLLTARAVLGMAQGIAFPAIHALLAKKVPNKVRSGAIGIIMALAHCGTALGFGASPALIDTLGWGWTFYLFGGAALLGLPFWLRMARDKGNQAVRTATAAMLHMQRQHAERSAGMVAAATAAVRQSSNNIVSTAGLTFSRAAQQQVDGGQQASAIQESTGATANHPILVVLEQQQQHTSSLQASSSAVSSSPAQQPNANVGLWPLMRRKEVWAIAVAQYAAGWGFYGLLAWLPQFFIEHCGLQLSQLGGFTLAPYLLQAVMGASAGLLADNLIVKRKWGVRDVRVLMQVAGMMGPALCLFAAASPVSSHSPYVATGLITLGMGLSALTCSGVSASHLDIAPRHAGVVFGVGNTAGTLAGLVAVPGLGYVLQQTGNWSLAFGLAAVHNVIGAILWAMWVGDKPLPEDGGPVMEGHLEPQQQLTAQPQQQMVAVAALKVAENEGVLEWKLKAA